MVVETWASFDSKNSVLTECNNLTLSAQIK